MTTAVALLVGSPSADQVIVPVRPSTVIAVIAATIFSLKSASPGFAPLCSRAALMV